MPTCVLRVSRFCAQVHSPLTRHQVRETLRKYHTAPDPKFRKPPPPSAPDDDLESWITNRLQAQPSSMLDFKCVQLRGNHAWTQAILTRVLVVVLAASWQSITRRLVSRYSCCGVVLVALVAHL